MFGHDSSDSLVVKLPRASIQHLSLLHALRHTQNYSMSSTREGVVSMLNHTAPSCHTVHLHAYASRAMCGGLLACRMSGLRHAAARHGPEAAQGPAHRQLDL